jgi:hypothetical protein
LQLRVVLSLHHSSIAALAQAGTADANVGMAPEMYKCSSVFLLLLPIRNAFGFIQTAEPAVPH